MNKVEVDNTNLQQYNTRADKVKSSKKLIAECKI